MAVGNIIQRNPRSGRRVWSGEFTGANGSISGVKFKGEITVAYSAEGVYIFTFVGTKPTRLSDFNPTIINPAVADGGSGRVVITADNLASAGTITVTTFNQANAAADIIGVAKFEFATEQEAA